MQGVSRAQAPLRIELAPEERVKTPTAVSQSPAPNQSGAERKSPTLQGAGGTSLSLEAKASECAFVASRNSKLYHAASCAVVKRIKDENKLCFKDAAEAVARGFSPGCVK